MITLCPPVVVNLRREEYDIYIGRPSILGNPHKVGSCPCYIGYHSRGGAIGLYEFEARGNDILLAAISDIPPLSRLGCYCHPLPCHGDIIVKLWKEIHG